MHHSHITSLTGSRKDDAHPRVLSFPQLLFFSLFETSERTPFPRRNLTTAKQLLLTQFAANFSIWAAQSLGFPPFPCLQATFLFFPIHLFFPGFEPPLACFFLCFGWWFFFFFFFFFGFGVCFLGDPPFFLFFRPSEAGFIHPRSFKFSS